MAYPAMLTTRQAAILKIITDAYIQTGEPIGSKTLLGTSKLGVSSATVRNEMAELEAMGLLLQPHISAGRVPSQAGYRYYVNHLLTKYRLSVGEMQAINSIMQSRLSEPDRLVEQAGEVVSEALGLMTVTVTPQMRNMQIRRLDLLRIDSHSFLLMVLTDAGLLQSRRCRFDILLETELLQRLFTVLNRGLVGKNVEKLTLADVLKLEGAMGEYASVSPPVLRAVYRCIAAFSEDRVHTAGVLHLLSKPELNAPKTIRDIASAFQDPQKGRTLLSAVPENSISVYIGSENPLEELECVSSVITSYVTEDGFMGTFGIIGPTRLDYSRVIAHSAYFAKNISRLLHRSVEESREDILLSRIRRLTAAVDDLL
ncbi:MAG: heat-inducible transcription repressor HrcA [Clostridia bacterium]|nr:heat-inducible transcription repressor HrcA [Clostridia bacterium]